MKHPPVIRQHAALAVLILAAALLAAPAAPGQDFTYSTNNDNTLTLIGYIGSGGDVTIPTTINGLTVTALGDYTFYGLSDVTSVTVPACVTYLGSQAFAWCGNLAAVYFLGNAPAVGGSGIYLIEEDYTIVYYLLGTTGWIPNFGNVPTGHVVPDGTVYSYTTNNNTIALTSYNGPGGAALVPDAVTDLPVASIGSGSFSNATSLTFLTVSSNVTSIGDNAFSGCTNLTGIYFLGNAPSLGTNVFSLDNNTMVYYALGTSGWGPTFGGLPAEPAWWTVFFYTTNTDNTITITGDYYSTNAAVIIPDKITGLPVTCIGNAVFCGLARVTSVSIADSVTNIGASAFEETDLTSVVVPDSVVAIGNLAFSQCAYLTNAVIGNGVTSIGNSSFASCTKLRTATIGTNVASIGNAAFAFCPSLTHIAIGGSVSSIGTQAFYACTNLLGVYFQGNAPTLGPSAFSNDNKATVYYLPGTTGWVSPFGGRPAFLWNPQPQGLAAPANQFGLTITGASNLVIVVEACTNLANPVWVPLATNTLTGGVSTFTDPQSSNYPARFYRFRTP